MVTHYTPPSGYIDFNAIGRGRRDRQLEQQADEVYDFNRDERQRQLEVRQWDRQAADYLAPLIGNRQAAVDAGVLPADFYVQQRQQILADPNYQALDAQAQARTLNQLQQSALVTAQQAQQRGDLSTANQLMTAFGVYPANTQVDLAAQTGDAVQLSQAIEQQYGSDLGFDPATNTVMIAGQRRPVVEALPNIYRARSVLGAYPAAGQALQAEGQLAQALRMAQEQRNREASSLRYRLLGELAKTGDQSALTELSRMAGIAPQSIDWSGVTSTADTTAQPSSLAGAMAALQPTQSVAATPSVNPGSALNLSNSTESIAPVSLAEILNREQSSSILNPTAGSILNAPSLAQLIQQLIVGNNNIAATPSPAISGYSIEPSGLTADERRIRIADLQRLLSAQSQALTAGLPFSDAQWRLQAELMRLQAEEAANGSL